MAEQRTTISTTTPAMETLNTLRRSPAEHLTHQMKAVEVTGDRGVCLREIPFVSQIGVRAWPGSATGQAAEKALDVTLPTVRGQTTGDAHGVHVIWLSPDEFLVVDVS